MSNEKIIAKLSATAENMEFERKDGKVTFTKIADDFEEMSKQADEVRKYRNEMIPSAAYNVLNLAADVFDDEDNELEEITARVEFGGVNYDITAHASVKVTDEDGDARFSNYLTIVSDDNFEGAIAILRAHAATLVSDDENVEDEVLDEDDADEVVEADVEIEDEEVIEE